MFIDPKTKTMDNWIYVKGRRNSKGNYQQLKKKKDGNSILSTIN